MKTTPTHRPLPTTPSTVLAEIDDILTGLLAPEKPGATLSLWSRARVRLLDAQPGAPCRPVGNGEPASGRSAFTHIGARASSSVVETESERLAEHGPGWEAAALDRFDALPNRLQGAVAKIADRAGWTIPPPAPGGLRHLTWCRWVLRRLIASNAAAVSLRDTEHAHQLAVQLGDLASRWSGRSEAKVAESRRLADDQSGMWCRSHLRVGAKEPRSERYPTMGLCRWCGDFHASERFLPTPTLLEARRDGRTITVTMVDAERPRKKKRK